MRQRRLKRQRRKATGRRYAQFGILDVIDAQGRQVAINRFIHEKFQPQIDVFAERTSLSHEKSAMLKENRATEDNAAGTEDGETIS